MGKAGRAACIFTPMALTIASFVCAILLQISGWNTLDSYYFFQANLTDLNVSGSGSGSSNTVLSDAIGHIRTAGGIGTIYHVHLWNYCSSNQTDGGALQCSTRERHFVFDPVQVWGFNRDNSTASPDTASSDPHPVETALDAVRADSDQYLDQLLGHSGRRALQIYRRVAHWMFTSYQIAFWTTLATLLVGLLAIFSRWGSFLTGILSVISTIFSMASVLTTTILFGIVVRALDDVLGPYGIRLRLGRLSLGVGWVGAGCSLAASLFWVLSICCCSGRANNPHHKSNKGGLWHAERKGQGYRDGFVVERRGREMAGSAGAYVRVASPYGAAPENGDHLPYGAAPENGDHLPLQDYGHRSTESTLQKAYEPFRHS